MKIFGKMAEPASIPDDGYVFAAKRRKGISDEPNPDSFWIDMPFLIQIAKAKEENPNWGAKKIEEHRSQGKSIWEDTELSEKRFQRTDLRGKRTWIWGYSNFIGHGFVGRHRFEERTRI
jgi:hypothetical protein